MKVYLDNAASTPLDLEVFEAMKPFMLENFGNPSSTHAHGRKLRAAIESARKKMAELLNCAPGEIIFTSGGTEADNAIIKGAIKTYSIKHAISSAIEHHAVVHTLTELEDQGEIKMHYVRLDEKGHVDLTHLESLLKEFPNTLVSLMHANNEIGNLLDIEKVSDLCQQYNAYFHSDATQTIGHYKHDLKKLKVHALAAAAHKFHGPMGVGFMYINKEKKIQPLILGGGQERNLRSGTENTPGIVGLTKALEICYREMDEQQRKISSIKKYMIEKLKITVPGISFNGDSDNMSRSLYTVLNVSFPESEENEMMLFHLDLHGISASGGSACASGATTGSHVLNALYPGSRRGAIRFSFSKFNTKEEIDFAVDKVGELGKVGVQRLENTRISG